MPLIRRDCLRAIPEPTCRDVPQTHELYRLREMERLRLNTTGTIATKFNAEVPANPCRRYLN